MFGNVTIEPTDFAVAVEDPEIDEVIFLHSGQRRVAPRLISGLRYDRLVRLRSEIKDRLSADNPLVGCGYCGHPVRLVQSVRKAFFFGTRERTGHARRNRAAI